MSQNTSHAVMAQRHEPHDSLVIITIREARAQGLRWYFSGRPCPQGHIAKRNVSNSECRACINAKQKRQRAAGSPKWKRKDAERWARDPKGGRAKNRAQRQKHLAKRRAYDRDRYQDPARHAWQLEQASGWWKKDATNRGKKNAITARRRAWIKLATPKWLTGEQLLEIRAFYLRAAAMPTPHHVDHKTPLRGKNVCGLNVPWNLQILPAAENRAKGNRYAE